MLHSRSRRQVQINSLLGVGLHIEGYSGVPISILGENMMSPKKPLETSDLLEVNVLGNLSPKPIVVLLWPGQDKVINIDREKQLLVGNPVGARMSINPL